MKPLQFPTPEPNLAAMIAELSAKIDKLDTTVRRSASARRAAAKKQAAAKATGACLECFHRVHAGGACPEDNRFGRCACSSHWTPRFRYQPRGKSATALRRNR